MTYAVDLVYRQLQATPGALVGELAHNQLAYSGVCSQWLQGGSREHIFGHVR